MLQGLLTQILQIISIDKNNLKISKFGDSFIYIWGWPGPDYNIYYCSIGFVTGGKSDSGNKSRKRKSG